MILDLSVHLLYEPRLVVSTDVFWVEFTHEHFFVGYMFRDLGFTELSFDLHLHILDLGLTLVFEIDGDETEVDSQVPILHLAVGVQIKVLL